MSYGLLRASFFDIRFGVHYCIAIGGFVVALRVSYLLWLHPLADVPGPKTAALTDLWKVHAVLRKRFSSTLHEQHVKYGDVVRIGPNEVSIISPDDVRCLYGHKSEYLKGPFYNAWAMVGKGHFSDRDEVTHRINRRAVEAAYSLNHLTSLERYCDACTELLSRYLDKASERGSVFDLSKLIEWYAYDSVSGIGFGSFFGMLENEGDPSSVLSVLASATQVIATMATLTNFGWLLPTKPVAWFTSRFFGNRGPNLFIAYASRLVKARLELRQQDPVAYEDGKDMLYRFMESINPSTSEPLDRQLLMSNTISIIVAGADTTRSSMVAFLRYVYAHPPTLKRLRREIDDAVAANHLTFPITYAQGARLEYTWACMKEAMRLHPAVGMPLQRVVPAGGRIIGGRFYRAGTLVGMSPREIHYDTRAYGKDADQWRPERWLEGDRNELERFSLIFGQGTRACLGKNISLMEMSKLLPTIVYRYDIKIKNPDRPWKVLESWFEPQSDFFCSVVRRRRSVYV